jgi:hypothetical protein
MTGKLKIQLDLDFGQPKWFPSVKVQNDWQVKNQLDLGFGQAKKFPSTKAQDDWQIMNMYITNPCNLARKHKL